MKIFVLVAILGLITIGLGAYGIITMREYNQRVEDIYEKSTVPSRIIGQILEKMSDNRANIFASLQHNPGREESKFHDHPVSKHIDSIDTNISDISALIEEYKRHPQDSKEEQLSGQFAEARGKYVKALFKAKTHINEEEWMEAARTVSAMNMAYYKARAAAAELSEYIEKRAEKTMHHGREAYEQQFMLMVGMVAASVLFGAGFGLFIVYSIASRISAFQRRIATVESTNDLSHLVQLEGRDEVSGISGIVQSLLAKIREAMAEISSQSGLVRSSAHSVGTSSLGIRQESEALGRATAEIAAATEELSASIEGVSDGAAHLAQEAQNVQACIGQGVSAVQATVRSMGEVSDSIARFDEAVEHLAADSARIGQLTAQIGEIADQTNLLALNAAIEAARAGEQGRGFAVVADEVRKLAERTTAATHDVNSLTGSIAAQVGQVRGMMSEGVSQAKQSMELGGVAVKSLEQISTSGEVVAHKAADISDAMREQSSAVGQIAGRVEQIAHTSEEVAHSAVGSHGQAQELERIADALTATVGRFQV